MALALAAFAGCTKGKSDKPAAADRSNAVQSGPSEKAVVDAPKEQAQQTAAKSPSTAETQKTEVSDRLARKKRADQAVKAFCSRCHAFPDPKQFTMQTWAEALRMKFSYFQKI